ncbi:MAG: TRAP transporter fused permease subunit [Atribacterota bacterium]|nr:TRAP transporter fused permease subunit [Atribacterota bacterium]MDD4896791.1 TRAP transporter fused permease subunit [Atribacterota bacterium]MDD5638202.1 TRAP transporter fused permease subunit [Atribacterota bacterium]
MNKSIDTFSRTREFSSTPGIALVLSTLIIIYVIYKVFNLNFVGISYKAASYLFLLINAILPLVFIWFPATKYEDKKTIPLYDWIIIILVFSISFYLSINAINIQNLGWSAGTAPWIVRVMCLILLIAVLEALRRVSGNILFLICLFFASYPIIAGYMPGILGGISFPFWKTITLHVLGGESMLGMVTRIVGNVVIGYLLFGVVFTFTGGGKFFIELATCILGKYRGGIAKVAVLSSAFFSSLSGSVVSNVISTGSFTIPAMKKSGYPPYFAAATEAVASTGGVLMPPVMGSVGFFCAQFLGIPYYQVALAAAIPSICYYTSLFVQIDLMAAKMGLVGIEEESQTSLKEIMKEGWYYLFVLFTLTFFIFQRQVAQAPFYAIAVLFILSMMKKTTRLNIDSLRNMVINSGKSIAEIGAILLGIGFIVGSLSMTGVVSSFSYEIVTLAKNNLTLILIFGATASFILGTGMVDVAAYIFLSLAIAPAIIRLGVYPLAAHLFVIYTAMISYITPPVALGAITAAGMAGANATKTGFTSMKIGIVGYIIPFAFVFNPALVGHGSFWKILISIIAAFLGIIFLSESIQKCSLKLIKLYTFERITFFISGLLLFFPIWQFQIIGVILGIAMQIILDYLKNDNRIKF